MADESSNFNDKYHAPSRTNWQDDESAVEAIEQDMTPGEGPSVMREVARLSHDLKLAKRRVIRVWSALLILLALLIGVIYWSLALNPKYRYIATNDNQAICEVSSETSPRHTPATIVEFAEDAVVNAYTYDYINYRLHINNTLNKWFSEEGRKAYMRSLDQSKNLQTVLDGRLVIKAFATQVPQLEEEGILSGTVSQKYWEVRVPIEVGFFANGATTPDKKQHFLAIVTVVQQQSSALNHKGLAIERINLASGKFDKN